MIAVCVSIGPPTEGGRLCPRYDAESGILAVTSESARDWLYGVDIDGNVIFDLDSERKLANFDIHVRRRLWERGAVRHWPAKTASGTIVFSEETIQQKSLNMTLRFIYDEEQDMLHVVLGAKQPQRELELSMNCIALLSGSELVGFLLRRF